MVVYTGMRTQSFKMLIFRVIDRPFVTIAANQMTLKIILV
jgi:hypothetical protein